MHPLTYVPLVLFAAVIANDWLLVRRLRKAVVAHQLKPGELEDFRSSGSPLEIVINLFRLRKIPATNDLSDPDHIAIRRHYRAQQILVGLLGTCIVALLILRAAA
ncbi:hypothetical protein CQ393_11460 [Stenotrophomonas sp. MYb238]|uniref:hypothetical protein n=1 Tax=Stenotrophomonas sp. MYb238 TaxID=2040281 RepID=UPI0012910CA3|nr:hypothetical protein [Stenotrophomonas sp. MYb238]MQP76505.1 hypothetical protein [Stenotrophomonas sp. MYb238]